MSTNLEIYVIWGIRFPTEQVSELFDIDDLDVYDKDGIEFLLDGVSGEYAFMGKMICECPFEETQNVHDISQLYQSVPTSKFAQILAELGIVVAEETLSPRLWLVSHYT